MCREVFVFLCACTGEWDVGLQSLTPTPSALGIVEMNLLLQQHYCDSSGTAGEEDNRDNIARFSREHVCFPASALGCASEQLC